MNNNTTASKTSNRKDLNMVIVSGRIARDISFVNNNGEARKYVFVELYTTRTGKDGQKVYSHYTAMFSNGNIKRLQKLNLPKGSALTVTGRVHAYSTKDEKGNYNNHFVIVGTDFFPTLMGGNTTVVNMTARLASKKVKENEKDSVIKMYEKGVETKNPDKATSILFNVAVDYLKRETGADGEDTYTKGTEFVPCVAYNTTQGNVASHILQNIKTGYLMLINGSLFSRDIYDENGKWVRRTTRILVNGVRTLSKTAEENAAYRKKYNIPEPVAKSSTSTQAPANAPAPEDLPTDDPDEMPF